MLTMLSAVLVGFFNSEEITKNDCNVWENYTIAWQVPGLTWILEMIVEGFLLLRWVFKKCKK